MEFLLSSLARALGGTAFGPDVTVDGASIDSRELSPDCLFVPIVAERDGHDFIEGAVTAGAAAYLTERGPGEGSGIVVSSTSEALVRLGAEARRRLVPPVIGVTGSVGKTSVKDMLAAACSAGARTHSNRASFNNELGLPLTLANAPENTEVTVVEMGSRGQGHVRDLCAVARPTIGIVTRVVLAHSELFGTIENVARAKGELIEALPASGVAVLNGNDDRVRAMADRSSARVMTYGRADSDVVAEEITLDELLRPTFVVRTPDGSETVRLGVSGSHMVDNALAAIAGGIAAGHPLASLVEGVSNAVSASGRMEIGRSPAGLLVINDAYNANPTSMRAGLASLVAIPAKRRVAILGRMGELGLEGEAEHRSIAQEAESAGVEVIAIDSPAYGPTAVHVKDIPAALEALGSVSSDDAVLVKASLSAGLQRLSAVLLA